MTAPEPPAVWWSPSLNTVITRGDHDHVYIDEHFALPADAVRLVPLVILPENFLTEHDADRFAAKMADIAGAVPDTGQARETGADRAARPRRFSPEDTLSVAERLGAAEPSGDTVQAPDEAALPGFLQMQDAIEGALRGAGHDLADMADVVYVATEAVRALLGTDPTPDRLAWIDTAAETAAAARQARYQETACARRPAEERPDA